MTIKIPPPPETNEETQWKDWYLKVKNAINKLVIIKRTRTTKNTPQIPQLWKFAILIPSNVYIIPKLTPNEWLPTSPIIIFPL